MNNGNFAKSIGSLLLMLVLYYLTIALFIANPIKDDHQYFTQYFVLISVILCGIPLYNATANNFKKVYEDAGISEGKKAVLKSLVHAALAFCAFVVVLILIFKVEFPTSFLVLAANGAVAIKCKLLE